MTRFLVLMFFLLASTSLAGCNRDGGGQAGANTGRSPGASPPDRPQPEPAAEAISYRSGSTIQGWGKVVDPDGDCKITRHPGGSVSFEIPDTLHELNPQKEKRNAPLIIQPVAGDFRVVVRVSGDFRPQAASNSRLSSPFHGAGMVLWADDANFLVLARNAWWRGGNEFFAFAPLFELFENGRWPRATNPPAGPASAFRGASTALYLERKGDLVRGAYSNDGQNWEGWREATVHLPREANIGVTAWNTAAKPFLATFDQFQILDR